MSDALMQLAAIEAIQRVRGESPDRLSLLFSMLPRHIAYLEHSINALEARHTPEADEAADVLRNELETASAWLGEIKENK